MSNKTEELSVALDRLNSGQTTQSNDQEISDLLEVAALLRNSDLPAKPPAHILSASVEQATSGLHAQTNRRRMPWVYSGLLGAAAAFDSGGAGRGADALQPLRVQHHHRQGG